MAISNTSISSSNTTIYTSSGNNAITTIMFCNTSAFNPTTPTLNQSLLYVYAVPNGGTVGTGTLIINGLPIPAGETVSLDQEKLVLANGDTIVAKTDSLSNITVTVSALAV
jgi:hypothetical protein